jgi:hypothetical protein
LAKAAKADTDADVARMIDEARQTLEAKAERSWLVWAGARLLPTLAREVEQEEAAQVAAAPVAAVSALPAGEPVDHDDQRTAKVLRRIAREDDAQEKRDALYTLYQAQEIGPDDLVTQMDQIDDDLAAAHRADASDDDEGAMDVDDDNGEDELDDDDGGEDDDDDDDDGAVSELPAIKTASGAAKRKRAATPEPEPGLVSQSPKVRRPLYSSFTRITNRFTPTVRPLRRDGQQTRLLDGAGRDTLSTMCQKPQEV